MEDITRRDGKFYYGEQECDSVDDAYLRFRMDYHDSLGRDAFRRLDRLGQRRERIHGYGFELPGREKLDSEFFGFGRTRYRILGLVGISYCRIVGLWDMPELDDEQFDRWFDWAFSKGSNGLVLVGRKDRSGRTSKRLKTRYK